MAENKMSEVFYFDKFTPEYDRTHYLSDPDGNLGSSFQQANDAFLRGGKPDKKAFKQYMEFCLKRSFVQESDVRKWFAGLSQQHAWKDFQANGSSEIVRNLIDEVFAPK